MILIGFFLLCYLSMSKIWRKFLSMSFPYTLYFCFAFFLTLFFSTGPSYGGNENPWRILVLQSYHADFAWTEDIMKGVHKVFDDQEQKVEYYIEYMDTKRFPKQLSTDDIAFLQEHLTKKYRDLPPQIIISVDDDALHFLMDRHEIIFPTIPVVFCGVNNPVDENKIAGCKFITGVMEVLDRNQTIDAALSIHPNAKKLAVITDTTTNGIGNRSILKELAKSYTGRIEFVFLDEDGTGITLDVLRTRLSNLDDNTIVYYADFFRDKDGFLDQQIVMPLLSRESSRPIYSPYSFIFGLGTVGGKLNSALFQGEAAAQIALRILQGTAPSQIPVIKESINRFMFDHRQMDRWGIRSKNLPAGSILMYKPVNFFEEYREIVIGTIIVFIILLSVIAALIVSIHRRKQAEAHLQVSLSKYKVLFETFPIGISITDAEGKILETNRISKELLSIPQSEQTKRQIDGSEWQIIRPDGSPMPAEEYASVKAFKEGRLVENVEMGVVKNNGDITWINVTAAPIPMKGYGVAITYGDITARKQAEERIDKLASVVQYSDDIIVVKDLNLRVAATNMAFVKASGHQSVEDLIGKTDAEILGIDPEAEPVRTYMEDDRKAQSLPPGEYILREEPVIQPSGEVRYVLTKKYPIFNAQGKLIGTGNISHDITERKKNEEALRKSEERHRTILQTAMDGFWMTDMQGRIMEVNETYCKMSGYSKQELLAKPIYDLEVKEMPDEITGHIQKIHSQFMDRFETKQRRKDGSIFDIEVSTQYQHIDGGRIVSFMRDITERKWAEAEKNKLQIQLVQAQKMESVGRLAGGVAHDFNNMLSIILGYTEMAMDDVSHDDLLFDKLHEIRNAALRSAELTRQLLAFARKQTIIPSVLNLNEIVEGMLKMLRRLIGEDIDLVWHPTTGLWKVNMDPSQIDQILANLCVNARDAIKGVGKVIIETENFVFNKVDCTGTLGFKPGDYVRLSVSDNGHGMEKETLEHVFEPFFTTKEIGKGTGLGLATIYGIVKQNNGFINVYSEPGQGTTFTIYLPRHIETNEQFGLGLESQETILIGCETILLVEDEPSILKMTQTMLKTLGYTVLAANTPAEAFRIAKDHTGEIHLLMTDVVMPEMNGYDLSKKLLSINSHLKQLFMSGYPSNVIAHHGILEKRLNFIQKPFSRKDLSEKVRIALV
ncbi:MAG: PAS domain S-box protein [Desulfobacterales bacterium]|nr:PAS domain S-box protein [Desulfobacterales bacterium]